MGLNRWMVAAALAVAVVGATPAASRADDPPSDPTPEPALLLPLIISYSTADTAQDYDRLLFLRYLYIMLGGDPSILPDLPPDITQ